MRSHCVIQCVYDTRCSWRRGFKQRLSSHDGMRIRVRLRVTLSSVLHGYRNHSGSVLWKRKCCRMHALREFRDRAGAGASGQSLSEFDFEITNQVQPLVDGMISGVIPLKWLECRQGHPRYEQQRRPECLAYGMCRPLA